MRIVRTFGLVMAALALTAACVKSGDDMADVALLNGTVWTANPAQPLAEALAIDDGRILAVGRTDEVKKLVGRKTRVVDLSGALAVPGFIDSHTHFLKGGFSLSSIQLRDVTTREEFARRVEAKARELEKGEWILEGNWDHEQMSPPELPRKEWIDAVSPEHPVCVSRYDLHMVLANSLALKIAGITKATKSPVGGEIQKDPRTGEPTGILRDAAVRLVLPLIPEPSLKTRLVAAEAALRHAAELGVTSVCDMADEKEFAVSLEVYQELLKRDALTTRISFYVPIDQAAMLEQFRMKTPFGNDRLSIEGLKGFCDGGLGASTAYMFEPYTSEPGNFGLLVPQMFPEGIMEKRIAEADRDGLQVAIHAIGDRANAVVLDIFKSVVDRNGPGDRRWRIEHAQHVRPADIPRFGQLGVIASVQPFHAIDDGRWAETKIGPERARTTYAFKSLLDGGATLALGSDWPVAPLNPLVGIYAAVTRRTTDGKNPGGWFPEQKLSLEEALKGFTVNGAYALFSDKQKGSLEVGKLADVAVVAPNLFEITSDKIKDAKVRLTISGGRIVYEKTDQPAR